MQITRQQQQRQCTRKQLCYARILAVACSYEQPQQAQQAF
jgi:hypothetical protein